MSTPMRSRGSREGSFGSSKVVVSERGQNMKTVLLGTIFPFAGAVLVAASGMLLSGEAFAGGGGCHEPLTDGRGTNVDLKATCFLTTVLHVNAGETVTFTNRDEAQHTVTGASSSW